MLRDTQLISLINDPNINAGEPLRARGLDFIYVEMRDPLPGDVVPYGIGHPSSRPYGFGPDSHENPGGTQSAKGSKERLESEVHYLWEPVIVSASLRVRDENDETSTNVNDEVLIDFIAYEEMQAIKDGPWKAADYDTVRNSVCKQPIAGFRTGQVGGRLVYATNAGRGYRFPRQANYNRNRCAAQYFRVWPLVLSWDISVTSVGCITIEYEWRLAQQ